MVSKLYIYKKEKRNVAIETVSDKILVSKTLAISPSGNELQAKH